ncbi:ECF transporter S component [Mycoplasma bradburyae]|uniref:ECF transporter S component n=1 Tax=Mycoplasma bradburyae TaxID=2963128 RepID=UPI002341E7AB|nr:ECF transporter S component [Mycoplasma bradburyae]MDC4183798.1 ECF transporter S component [Mycoplasma bradburyae]
MQKIAIKNQFDVAKKPINKLAIIRFFLPFWPLKLRYNIYLISFLSMFIALKVVLGFFVIKIGPTISLGISWVGLALIGWIFGPVTAIPIGFLTDTLSFILGKGGVWYWLYAIQEPMIVFTASLFGSIYRIRKQYSSNSLDFLFQQVLIIGFCVSGFIFLSLYNNTDTEKILIRNNSFGSTLSFVFIGLFFIFSEIISWLLYLKNKKTKESIKLFLYVSTMMITLSVLYSLVLGTISINEFLINVVHQKPKSKDFILSAYLIPRVIKETLRLPILIICVISLIKLSEPHLENFFNLSRLRW